MTYLLFYSPAFEKQLSALMKGDRKLAQQIREAAAALAENPRPPGVTKMEGFTDGRLRIKVRTWRVVYTIHDKHLTVHVMETGPRKDVYRRM